MPPVLVLASAYLLGSIPFSFLVARLFGVADVRKVGSGNVGATNVARTAGRGPGLLAFLLDASKGAVAVVVAERFVDSPWPVLAGAVAVVAHMYPVWLGFKGGKGVATGAGAFLPIAPRIVLLSMAVFAVTTAITRFVSLGSVLGCGFLAAALFATRGAAPESWTAALLAAVIIWKHRANLERIARGRESRIGGQRS